MLEIFILLVLLFANSFLALAELSIVSSRKGRLALMAEKKVRGARSALSLAEKQDDFLSAVQVGITMVGILSGVYGGVAFADDLSKPLSQLPLIGPYSWTVAYGSIVMLLTYLSVIVGELVPKQLALSAPETFACIIAPPMKILVAVASPLVWLLSKSSAVVLKIFGQKPNQTPAITEEDLSMVITEASRAGAIDKSEMDFAARAIRLGDMPVTSIMTPRTEVVWIRLEESLPKFKEKILSAGHSHIPVCRQRPDDVVGVLKHKEALLHFIKNGFSADDAEREAQIRKILSPPTIVPSTLPVARVVEIMKKEKVHFAVVADEYGGMEGVVSNHDLLEALVGHIPGDKKEEDAIITRKDGSRLVAGWVRLDEVFRELAVSGSRDVALDTVALFMIHQFGKIPAVGEITEEFGLRFEILDKEGTRIDRVLVSLIPEPGAEGEETS